jgi:tRNA/rRNA methyltransferase
MHIVLVEPAGGINVGAVARAMSNFGFSQLHLVAPRGIDFDQARMMACWGEKVLRSAKTYDSLEECLGEMEEVVGFTARTGADRTQHYLLPDWAETLAMGPLRKTALVFGPEESGLRCEHINLCRVLVKIPTHSVNPSLNLGQAVLLALAEISRQDWGEAVPFPSSDTPDWNDYFQLDRMLDDIATRSGFYRKGTPATVPGMLKNLFRRIGANTREIAVLLGLFSRVAKALAGRVPVQNAADHTIRRLSNNPPVKDEVEGVK